MNPTGKTKTATPYTVTKRTEGRSFPSYDTGCRFCDWTSRSWDYRRNAVRAGFDHVASAHPSAPKRVTVTA